MATYTALREIVAMVRASSSAATPDNSFKFLEALDRAEFLFGAKVIEHLQKIRQAIHDIHDMVTERKDLQSGPELIENVAKERAAEKWWKAFTLRSKLSCAPTFACIRSRLGRLKDQFKQAVENVD